MTNSEMINKALIFATEKHWNHKRKYSDLPYIIHPIEVANIISSITVNPEVIVAGFLHDTIEDCHVKPEEIEQLFGNYVLELVKSETEDKYDDIPREASWSRRKQESLELHKSSTDINVKILWLADKLSNVRSFCALYKKEGLAMWSRFNEKDPKVQKWYYYEILNNTAELSETEAYMEFRNKIDTLFKEVE